MVPLLCHCPTPTPFNDRDVVANEAMAMAGQIDAATMARMRFRCRGRANPACVRVAELTVRTAAVKYSATAKRLRSPLQFRTKRQPSALHRKWNAYASKRPARGQSRARSNDHTEQI